MNKQVFLFGCSIRPLKIKKNKRMKHPYKMIYTNKHIYLGVHYLLLKRFIYPQIEMKVLLRTNTIVFFKEPSFR